MLDTAEAPAPLEDDNPIAAEHYGAKKAAIEPGGVERIPASERHGTPLHLLWTWSSPNMEFATIAVGILGPLYWGLSFAQTVAAIVLGTLLGAITQGILSSWGPETGLCQMVLSRTGFGFLGNALPAGLNAVVAGVGWFAVNSISGTLALHALVHGAPKWLCLVVIVVLQLGLACFGHNLVQAFERYALPLLLVVFVAGAAVIFHKSHLSASGSGGTPTVGAFLLMTAAAFGYACGWNPYAADYSRYLPASSSRRRTGLYSAAGLFLSCAFLESAGAAMVFAAGKNAAVDPGVYTGLMASWLGKLTLLCIALGAVAANALNIYSGAMSFLTVGIRLPGGRARVVTALVFGLAGFARAVRHQERRHQLRELPARDRLLDRAVARCRARGSVDPSWRRRGGDRAGPRFHQLGRPDCDARRLGGVDLAVCQPDQVHRAGPQGAPGLRRHHVLRRLRPLGGSVPRASSRAPGATVRGGTGHAGLMI
jgi:purine-cytosine permease-like protein